ncbi:hypothetical protein AAFF_G00352670 [Aldrovandia affinis]|uniref:Uncharacterized protein n=1 Tax=Aldrovandia affinis TaxID=143900 RepID=A0AAD7SJI9_9TELE|nr:hypothetical protein AAFF_G00352670 [Aldrovandia affinis]
MALFLDGSQSVGAYYCLIRRRFKRRRKKRSERKERRVSVRLALCITSARPGRRRYLPGIGACLNLWR